MKIKQRKCTVVIKNLRSAYISDQKTNSVYFKLRPLPPLSYATYATENQSHTRNEA